jgi:uncharacterized protein YdaU (DUF1376 family)
MKIRYVHFFPDEWIAGTVGMTLEEEGAYIRLIVRYYSRGEALPADPVALAHLCNVRPQIMRRLLGKLAPKFEQTDGKLRSNRCETEMKRVQNRNETTQFHDTKAANSNGLDASHTRAHTRTRAGNLKTKGLELSDPIQVRESSKPARLRAREVAMEGASHASATPSKRSVGEPGAPPWEQRCRAWAENGFWMEIWGPEPSEAGCNAPAGLAAEARKARNGHDASPPPRTPEDIVAVDALVKETLTAIKRKAANANGPVLTRLDNLDAWVDRNLDGDERTLARKAIEETRKAGDDTPTDIRKLVDAMDELRRSQPTAGIAC